jgi:1-acyl-sn-glycerol-3-phosphate acyltransferase
MAKERLNHAWYWFARLLCQIFCTLLFRLRTYGKNHIPKRGPFILACNHQSFLDPVFVGVGLRRHLVFMARDTLFRSRFFGGLIHSVNAIPIGRDRADVAAMKKILSRLKEGRGVCLFPEGTRTDDGRIASFKAGFGLLCRRAKAPVLPVLIDGAFECWPRRQKLFSSGEVNVVIGRPLPLEQIEDITNQELADHLTQTLRQMQTSFRTKRGTPAYDY